MINEIRLMLCFKAVNFFLKPEITRAPRLSYYEEVKKSKPIIINA